MSIPEAGPRTAGDAKALQRIDAAARAGATELDLHGLGLQAVPPLPAGLFGLRRLNLNGNRLRALPPGLWELAGLERLELANNRLADLPPDVARLTRLTHCDLSENRLPSLPAGIVSCSRLAELDLFGNRLTALPEALPRLTSLERLDASSNLLSALPPCDGGFPRLQALDLGNNRLQRLPSGIGRLPALRVLNLAGNRLTSVAELADLASLAELTLDDNELEELPAGLAHLPRLLLLSAQGNPLGELPPAFAEVSRARLRQAAERAIRGQISGGPEEGKRYFDAVSFVFGFSLAVSSLAGVYQLIDFYYKRFASLPAVVVKYPDGTTVELNNLTRTRARELARQHEALLEPGKAMVDLGGTTNPAEVEKTIDWAAQAVTRDPRIELVPKTPGQPVIQFNVFQKEEYVFGDKISFGDVTNSNVNVKSHLDNVSQVIGRSNAIDQSVKTDLNRLVSELAKELDKVPPDQKEDAEAVAESVEDLVTKATKESPNRKVVQATLKTVLETAAVIAGAIPIVKEIATVIGKLFGF